MMPMPNNVQGSPLQNAQFNPPRGPLMARDNRMDMQGGGKAPQPAATQPTAPSKTPAPNAAPQQNMGGYN